jgi:FixJ family two-component response regulator
LLNDAYFRFLADMGNFGPDQASAEKFLSAGRLGEFVCLILDVHLPGISGIDLQNQLRADGNNITVIFITAHPDEHTRQLAVRAGAIRFFSKPFSGNDLLTAVRTRL